MRRGNHQQISDRRDRAVLGLGGLLWAGLLLLTASGASAAELAEIQERGYLVVGVKENVRPLGFRTAEGELAGLEIDLARWLATELLGDPEAIVFQPVLNQERLPALLTDQVDLVIAHLSVTAGRARLVDFSVPYFLDGTSFITQQAAIQTLSDLQQESIAVLTGSDTIAIVRSYLPQAQLVGVSSYAEAQQLLDMGQVTALAADATLLTGWVQEDPRYHLVPTLLSATALSVAMPRGLQYDPLRQAVNQAIEQWQAEGTLQAQIEYWGLPAAGLPTLLP